MELYRVKLRHHNDTLENVIFTSQELKSYLREQIIIDDPVSLVISATNGIEKDVRNLVTRLYKYETVEKLLTKWKEVSIYTLNDTSTIIYSYHIAKCETYSNYFHRVFNTKK